jgi:hypothetical protein
MSPHLLDLTLMTPHHILEIRGIVVVFCWLKELAWVIGVCQPFEHDPIGTFWSQLAKCRILQPYICPLQEILLGIQCVTKQPLHRWLRFPTFICSFKHKSGEELLRTGWRPVANNCLDPPRGPDSVNLIF